MNAPQNRGRKKRKIKYMAKVNVKSSTVASVDYDSKSKEMTVEFLNGSSYVYEKVPESVYSDFMKAESKGKFVAKSLRNKFTDRRVES